MKTCFKCELSLPRSEFYSHSRMGDGLLGKCKSCTRKDTIENRTQKADRYRAYDRDRAKKPHRKLLNKVKSAKLRNKDGGIRMRAWNALRRAVYAGKIARQTFCSRCPATEFVAAHHDDYGKPLDVMWLCPVCHAARHKELNRLRVTAVAYGENMRLVF